MTKMCEKFHDTFTNLEDLNEEKKFISNMKSGDQCKTILVVRCLKLFIKNNKQI